MTAVLKPHVRPRSVRRDPLVLIVCDGGGRGRCRDSHAHFGEKSTIARKAARDDGWRTNVANPQGWQRLDFCPAHRA